MLSYKKTCVIKLESDSETELVYKLRVTYEPERFSNKNYKGKKEKDKSFTCVFTLVIANSESAKVFH